MNIYVVRIHIRVFGMNRETVSIRQQESGEERQTGKCSSCSIKLLSLSTTNSQVCRPCVVRCVPMNGREHAEKS